MTMLVSIRPRVRASPVTAERVLVGDGVNVGAEPLRVEDRGGRECGHDFLARDEDAAAQRDQAPDRGAVAADGEGLAPLHGPHDRARFVTELALGNLTPRLIGHTTIVRRCATRRYSLPGTGE